MYVSKCASSYEKGVPVKRLAVVLAVCAVMSANAFAEDFVCPPGAKYCPAPGSNGQAALPMNAPFGLGAPEAQQFAQHASQLREGEQLIMVGSADGGMAMMPQMASAPAPMPMPGFMPPPPGAPRARAPVQAQASRPVARRPAPEKRPEQMSEVANQTSRKSDLNKKPPAKKKVSKANPKAKAKAKKNVKKNVKKNAKANSKAKTPAKSKKKVEADKDEENRIPWWKGGLWRN